MESPGLKLEASQRCLEPRPLCLCMLPGPWPAAGGAREQGKVGKPVSTLDRHPQEELRKQL